MDHTIVTNQITGWIKEKIETAPAKGIVIGLSGGIDSSVTAALCTRATPNVLGLIMPCESNPADKEFALRVARLFSIKTIEVNLNRPLYAMLDATGTNTRETAGPNNIPVANLKARLRMTTLYYHANKNNYLVAGSGDRSEFQVGYFTKYGDGGADIFPVGNLLKTEVQELGIYLNVPREICEKAPSAGLWSGQLSEVERGLSYKDIDEYLKTGEGSSEIKQRYEYLHNISQHKRALPPVPEF